MGEVLGRESECERRSSRYYCVFSCDGTITSYFSIDESVTIGWEKLLMWKNMRANLGVMFRGDEISNTSEGLDFR